MARFCDTSSLLDLTDLGGAVCEIPLDGFQGWSTRPGSACFGDIGRTQLLHLHFRSDVLIFGAGEIEGRLLHEPRRLRTLEEDKVLVLPDGIESNEMQLFPERVELAPAGLVQNQRAQRSVITVITLHQVEAGTEQAALGAR